jgi:hypothetical protein
MITWVEPLATASLEGAFDSGFVVCCFVALRLAQLVLDALRASFFEGKPDSWRIC